MPPGPEIVDAPRALLGSADVTRRHGLRFADGVVRFAGLTRPEADRARDALGALGPGPAGRALVEVALPAILSDGAGPHLVDADGRLILAVAAHPRVPGARVAMGAMDGSVGPGGGREVIGLVRRHDAPVWVWANRAVVPWDARIAALDALDAAADDAEARAWEAMWG